MLKHWLAMVKPEQQRTEGKNSFVQKWAGGDMSAVSWVHAYYLVVFNNF